LEEYSHKTFPHQSNQIHLLISIKMNQKFGYRLAVVLSSVILIQGCAVNKQLVSTGGSRSDGTVKMSYEYGAFQAPKVNMQQGQQGAKQRCAAWGYTDAEPFGGSTRTCASSSGGSCDVWRVTVEYQCTGTPSAVK